MDNFFYTMNFTVSNLLLYGFLLLYSHICVGKPRKGWALATGLIILLIDLIFAIIPWVLYGDASCWIIQTHRNGFTALHWCIFLLFFLTGFPQEKLLTRFFLATMSFLFIFLGDTIQIIAIAAIDNLAGTNVCSIGSNYENWHLWYRTFLILPELLIMASLAFVFQSCFSRSVQLYSAKTFWLLIFPVTQFFAIYTLIAILQQFGTISTSPKILAVLIVTILLNVASNIMLLHLMKRMHIKEQEKQKVRFYEEYEKLSAKYQEQIAQASHEQENLKRDFHNQIGSFGLMQTDHVEDAGSWQRNCKQVPALEQLYFCENTVANVILQQTAETCAKSTLHLKQTCSAEDIGIRKVDLCSLLINPLQNAIQASEAVPEAEREISCTIWQDGEMVFLRICNRKNHQIQTKNGKVQTTKADKEKHGFGIEIIEHLANTYGGIAVASYDDQFFTVTIQLNLPAENNTEKIAEEAAVVCP
ncbi:MAG: ATP-binding protein [Ruminococcus callidus]